MSVAEAVGRLSSFEESQRGSRRQSGGKEDQLMLMTQALAQQMKGKKGSPGANSSSNGGGQGRGGGRGHGRGRGDPADRVQAGRGENNDHDK